MNIEIVLDFVENEENYVCYKSLELFNEEYFLFKIDDKKFNLVKSFKWKRRRKLDIINVFELLGKIVFLGKDEIIMLRIEYCVNDFNELNFFELYIDGIND